MRSRAEGRGSAAGRGCRALSPAEGGEWKYSSWTPWHTSRRVSTARALEAHESHVMRAAQAAHARARSECLRAMRGARRAWLEQLALEASRRERRSARGSPAASEAAERQLSRLRPRELEVTLLLAAGLHTREVAETFFITEATVRTHIKLALRRGGVHSREELLKLLAPARATDTVRLAARRVQPFLDQWWLRDARRDGSPILLSEALSALGSSE